MFDINNWWLDVLAEGANEILDSVGDTFFGWILSFYNNIAWFTDNINPLCNITVHVASILLVLMASKNLVTTYLLETDGDSDIDPLQYMVKVTMTLAIIQSHSFVFEILQRISTLLCKALDNALNISVPTLSMESISTSIVLSVGGSMNIFSLILRIVYVIMLIMMLFKAFLRAVELGMQKALFPIFCVDFLSPGREKWKNFSMSYGVTFVGYCIQYVCFRLSVSFLFMGTLKMVMASIATIYFAIKSPKWIEKYVYTSGVGQNISGGARTAAYMLPTLLRMGR